MVPEACLYQYYLVLRFETNGNEKLEIIAPVQ